MLSLQLLVIAALVHFSTPLHLMRLPDIADKDAGWSITGETVNYVPVHTAPLFPDSIFQGLSGELELSRRSESGGMDGGFSNGGEANGEFSPPSGNPFLAAAKQGRLMRRSEEGDADGGFSNSGEGNGDMPFGNGMAMATAPRPPPPPPLPNPFAGGGSRPAANPFAVGGGAGAGVVQPPPPPPAALKPPKRRRRPFRHRQRPNAWVNPAGGAANPWANPQVAAPVTGRGHHRRRPRMDPSYKRRSGDQRPTPGDRLFKCADVPCKKAPPGSGLVCRKCCKYDASNQYVCSRRDFEWGPYKPHKHGVLDKPGGGAGQQQQQPDFGPGGGQASGGNRGGTGQQQPDFGFGGGQASGGARGGAGQQQQPDFGPGGGQASGGNRGGTVPGAGQATGSNLGQQPGIGGKPPCKKPGGQPVTDAGQQQQQPDFGLGGGQASGGARGLGQQQPDFAPGGGQASGGARGGFGQQQPDFGPGGGQASGGQPIGSNLGQQPGIGGKPPCKKPGGQVVAGMLANMAQPPPSRLFNASRGKSEPFSGDGDGSFSN